MARNLERPGVDGPEAHRPEQVIGFLFKSLHHGLRQAMDEALRRHGLELSFAHLATLFGLHFEPGSTGAQLARRAMVSPQTMNPVLRRLEAEGLIERRPHPDSRRADSWFLTERGTEQFRRARAVGTRRPHRRGGTPTHPLATCVGDVGQPLDVRVVDAGEEAVARPQARS